jgi:4-amino-4-deoxy-L-arabinose transferase-like glycosyltransferase
MMLGASLMIYRFGRIWYSKEAGIVAALLLQVLPVFFGVGLIATMDSALVFFWMVGLLGITAALHDSRPGGWYLAGVALGGALLSKYTGIFLAVGTGLVVILNPDWRRHLRTPHRLSVLR